MASRPLRVPQPNIRNRSLENEELAMADTQQKRKSTASKRKDPPTTAPEEEQIELADPEEEGHEHLENLDGGQEPAGDNHIANAPTHEPKKKKGRPGKQLQPFLKATQDAQGEITSLHATRFCEAVNFVNSSDQAIIGTLKVGDTALIPWKRGSHGEKLTVIGPIFRAVNAVYWRAHLFPIAEDGTLGAPIEYPLAQVLRRAEDQAYDRAHFRELCASARRLHEPRRVEPIRLPAARRPRQPRVAPAVALPAAPAPAVASVVQIAALNKLCASLADTLATANRLVDRQQKMIAECDRRTEQLWETAMQVLTTSRIDRAPVQRRDGDGRRFSPDY